MLVSFNFDKNLFFVLAFIVIFLGIHLITNTSNQNKIDKNVELLYSSISQLATIILYFLEKLFSKKNNDRNTISTLPILKNQELRNFIILSSIIFYIIFYYINIKFSIDNKIEWGLKKYCQMCLIVFIDIIFFKNEKYLHQTTSMIMNFIFTIILFIFQFQQFDYIIFLLFLCCYSYTFSFLIVKYINIHYFMSVYIFGGIFGLIEIILLLIIKGLSFNFNFNLIHLLLIFLMICNNYLFYYIIDKLSPVNSMISICISLIVFFSFLRVNNILEIIRLIIFIISIISCLIYLEIIELNFCNLNYNLKKNIIKREKEEKNLILSIDYEDNE